MFHDDLFWMPFHVADYFAQTQRLTTEQHGAYLLLLLDYWRNGAPPDDDRTLRVITRLSQASWRKNRPIVAAFFSIENGRLRHAGLENARGEAEAKRAGNVARGKHAANCRWSTKSSEKVDASSNALSNSKDIAVELLGGCQPSSPLESKSKGRDSKSSVGPQPIGRLSDKLLRDLKSRE